MDKKDNERSKPRTGFLSDFLGLPLLIRSQSAPTKASTATSSPLLSAAGNRGVSGFLKKYGLAGVVTGTNRRHALDFSDFSWHAFLKRYGLAGVSAPLPLPVQPGTGLRRFLVRYGLASALKQ